MADQGQNYLEAMSMLKMLLEKADAGSRVQVPKDVASQIQNGISMVVKKIGFNEIPIWVSDYTLALGEICDSDVTFLTNDMKSTVVKGIEALRADIARRAYAYFSSHDFTPKEKTIPIFKDIVYLYHFS